MIIKVLLIGFMLSFMASMQTNAHTLVTDGDDLGAIVHVSPDDDPVVNQDSTVHFDISSSDLTLDQYYYALTVTEPNGENARIGVDVTDDLLVAEYSFPERGEYIFEMTATDKLTGEVRSISHIQEVRREAGDSPFQLSDGVVAPLIALWTFAGLVILVSVYRKQHSTVVPQHAPSKRKKQVKK